MSDENTPSADPSNQKSIFWSLWKTEDILNIFEIIAIIAGGIWSYYQYEKFEKADKELASKSALIESHIKEYDKNIKAIESEKETIALNLLKSRPIDTASRISIEAINSYHKKQKKYYLVNFHYSIKNITKERIKLNLSAIQMLTLNPKKIHFGTVVPIQNLSDGDTNWNIIDLKVNVADSKTMDDEGLKSMFRDKVEPIIGGSIIGDLEPGESSWGTSSYILALDNSYIIGFRALLNINFKENENKLINLTQAVTLKEGEYSSSTDIESDKNSE